MTDREALARTFDRSAELYDEVRPGYPERLFDDLARLAGLGQGSRLLELGCGTGKASLPLARRGLEIVCLEPGENLAAVARRNLAQFGRTRVLTTTFEAWPQEHEAFDLVYAATSWTWMEPRTKYRKVTDALKPGGYAAIFENLQVESRAPEGFWAAVQDCYRRHAPDMVGSWPTMEDLPSTIEPGFSELGFEEVAVLRYPWVEAYNTERYLKVLQTFSGHIALPDDIRGALLEDIGELIEARFGGVVYKHWHTVLQLARKGSRLPRRA